MKKKTEGENRPRLFVRRSLSGKGREKLGKKTLFENGPPREFPNIYRRITEKISQIEALLILKSRVLILLMISLVLLSLIISSGLDLIKVLNQKQKLEQERLKITAEIEYWQQVIGKYKNYRDAYFQLAVLEYKIGEKELSKQYLQKVFELDPNFEVARNLEKLL